MDKNELLERLARPCESSREEWLDAREALRRYPYAVPLRLLVLAGDKVWGEETVDGQRLSQEALYLPNRMLLRRRVEQAREYKPVPERFDVMQEINAYQEVSFKTAPKSVILSNFLKSGNIPMEDEEGAQAESLEALGKKSIAADNVLVSETLALVLEKQGKTDKAIEMYEKLAAQNTEKSSTFASRAAELRKAQGKS